jgi:hypothetical protein
MMIEKVAMAARWRALAFFFAGCVLLVTLVLKIPPDQITDPAVKLLGSLLWIYVLAFALIQFRPQLRLLLMALLARLRQGGGIKTPFFELTAVEVQANRIPLPERAQPITLANIALLHTSFFSLKRTQEINNGLRYYQIEVIVIARHEVLNQINLVTYHLENAWPEPRTRRTNDRGSRFKLKELANGTSIIRADIELKDGKGVLTLNRFIDLREEGPRL